MATYHKCDKCGHKITLPFKARSQVPLIYFIKCPKCGYINIIAPQDVEEENVFRFQCPVCGKQLFVEGRPPFKVRCTLCKSLLEINENERVKVIEEGEPPRIRQTAALLGALAKDKNRIQGFVGGLFIGMLIEQMLKEESEAECIKGESRCLSQNRSSLNAEEHISEQKV